MTALSLAGGIRVPLGGLDDVSLDGVAKHSDSGVRLAYVAGAGSSTHLVQFYDEEKFLCEAVCAYVSAGFAPGEPVIIIATAAHQKAFSDALRASGVDVEHAAATRQLTLLDAHETLAQFMREGTPDSELFEMHVGALLREVREAWHERPARAYGEMVDVLWKSGNRQGAIRLEQLWNELATREAFSLVCGYGMDGFQSTQDLADFERVCSCHSHVSPTESFSKLLSEDVRLREVSALQQRARALEAEIAHRKALEADLREREDQLRDFLDNAVDGIHWVDANGVILYANKAELALLGYRRSEYVGRNITEFHVDRDVIQNLLDRLRSGQTVADCEARLRTKDGAIKHVLVNSNVLFRDGKFVHTRCFSRDITARKEAEDALRQAEARFRTMHEATPDGVGVTLPVRDQHGTIQDFRFTYANPVIARDFEVPADALVGRTLLGLRPGLDKTPVWPALCRVAESGQPEIFEHSYAENGRSRSFRNIVVSLGQELALTYSDVTGRKRAEESLRFLAEASTILASSLDHDATLSSVVKLAVPTIADWAACDMLSPDGTLRRLAVAHVDPAKAQTARRIYERFPPIMNASHGVGNVVRTGKAEHIRDLTDAVLDATFEDAEALAFVKTLGLRSSVCVPLAVRGHVVGAFTLAWSRSGRHYTTDDVGLVEELARRASLAIENAVHYKAAADASLAKDEFLAVVSHELRTPLNAILGWVHMLRDDSVPANRRSHALETIERNARAQNQLIDDLLDISRIVAGKLRLDICPVDLQSVIERAIETVRPAASAKNISLKPPLDAEATPIVGDADRLQQVVWNLLSNAVKFSPKGSDVEIVLRRHEFNVEIVVRDQGQGIDADFLPHVFERFRQADASSARGKGGLGLGLAIVRNLVELHGGSIRAESEGGGRGATFTVSLPISPLRLPSFVRPPALHLTAVAPHLKYPSEVEGLDILVVDDEADARELLSALLARCKMRITTAATVDEALALVRSDRPDIVISDIGMPGEDGYALIKRLRALAPEDGGRTPAVALTAFARTEERTKALVSGFNMHVPKPVEPAELLAVLASLASGFPKTAPPANGSLSCSR
jgi:PAS domain S-box-containing protein